MSRIATIGFFDGVHRGHQYLFEQLAGIAGEQHLQPLIVTFEQHPRQVLQADFIPQLLTTPAERKALLEQYGEVVMLPFEEVQPLTAAQFMRRLKEEYDVRVILMGYDHRFGSDGLKHPHEYRALGAETGIEVLTMNEYVEGEWHVSSTEIRRALENGNVVVAAELLGRPYELSGTVVHGRGIGRSLGFPTANIAPENTHKILPRAGVYSVRVTTSAMTQRPAMLNIGTNPTVGNETQTIEVHIPSFEGDLYGERMTILFDRFIREEKRFDSLQELQEQIKADVDSSLHRDADPRG